MTNVTTDEFAVHDRVVHPAHGPGMITAVEQMEAIIGYRNYYVIDIFEQNLTVRIPVRRAERAGLRKVMPTQRIDGLMETLRSEPTRLPDDYKRRQAEVRQRMKSSRPGELAELIRDLFKHGERQHLTSVDTELLRSCMDRLAWEMACAADRTPASALEEISRALDSGADEQSM